MSKEKPEVGDIWLDKEQRKLFLFMITPKYLNFIRRKWGSSKDRVTIVTRVRSSFDKGIKFTYLGKSVVDVSKLFTVKSFDEKQYRKDMFGEDDD